MKKPFNILVLYAICILKLGRVKAQDYDVADIRCTFGAAADGGSSKTPSSSSGDLLTAKLRRPEGFLGTPIFADDRHLEPEVDPHCQIRSDPADALLFELRVTDLSKCGVLMKNGFVNLRIWFPKLAGVVMMSDQEVIIMCKPADSIVTTNKSTGFAGKLPPAARVSGIVEEIPGKLEYEVALFRETSSSGEGQLANEVPVDQAVPIGTKLQLRATINTESAWKHVKLIEVTISPDSADAYAKGHIMLIKEGCRVEDFFAILPRQPYRPEDNSGEVRLEFEAVLLDSQRSQANQLWIHAKIRACIVAADCVPEFCLDLNQPKGAGRRRRGLVASDAASPSSLVRSDQLVKRDRTRDFFPLTSSPASPRPHHNATARLSRKRQSEAANFGDNVGVTVTLPGEELYFDGDSSGAKPSISLPSPPPDDCQTFLIVGGVLGSLLVLASGAMCLLSHRLFRLSRRYKKEKLADVVRDHRRKFGGGQLLAEPVAAVESGVNRNFGLSAEPAISGLMRLQQQRDQLRQS